MRVHVQPSAFDGAEAGWGAGAQDWAVVEMVRRLAPSLPVHASTQMSVTSAEGVAFAGALSVERVVLGRELSISDMDRIKRQLAEGPQPAPELEAFVHGALCVSYR